MKTWMATFILALLFFATVQAQAPSLRITANSEEVADHVVKMNNEKRILWQVIDGMQRDAGYAYEFGPIFLISPGGARVELRGKAVNNGPVHYITLRRQLMNQYPNGFDLEIESITRHNPDHSIEVLPFDVAMRHLQFIPADN